MADAPNVHPTIHQRMIAILDEMPAIGKNKENKQQGFKFRGVDDVMDALNPLLGKHGVFFLPDTLERRDEVRSTARGGNLYVVQLHVRYTFYGPAGDTVTATVWGEGTDSGDKATQKALTSAEKYCLFQAFAIATTEGDGDAETPEDSKPLHEVLRERLYHDAEGDVEEVLSFLTGYFGDKWKGKLAEHSPKELRDLERYLDKQDAEAQNSPGEGPPTDRDPAAPAADSMSANPSPGPTDPPQEPEVDDTGWAPGAFGDQPSLEPEPQA